MRCMLCVLCVCMGCMHGCVCTHEVGVCACTQGCVLWCVYMWVGKGSPMCIPSRRTHGYHVVRVSRAGDEGGSMGTTHVLQWGTLYYHTYHACLRTMIACVSLTWLHVPGHEPHDPLVDGVQGYCTKDDDGEGKGHG